MDKFNEVASGIIKGSAGLTDEDLAEFGL
jgi:hypothetical protein